LSALEETVAITANTTLINTHITNDGDTDDQNEIELPDDATATSGDVLATDAAGNYSWITPITGNNLSNTNLTQTGDKTYDLNDNDLTFDITNSLLSFTGTNSNVGIGNITPQDKLDVDGQIRARGGFASTEGSAGNPGYGFYTNGDTNMGMYRIAADQLGFSTNGLEAMRIDPTQNIATTGNLSVGGTISTTISGQVHPDYVFQKYFLGKSILNPNYEFTNLSEIEEFVKANNHLPGIKSAAAIKEQGFWDLGEASRINLEKIEELFLHTIEQEKKIKQLEATNKNMASEVEALKAQMEEIKKLFQFIRPLIINSESVNLFAKSAYFFENANNPISFTNSYDTFETDLDVESVSTNEFWRLEGTIPSKITLSWNQRSAIIGLTDDVTMIIPVGWNKNSERWTNLVGSTPVGSLNEGFITTTSFIPDDYEIITLGVSKDPYEPLSKDVILLDNFFVSVNGDGVNDSFFVEELQDFDSNFVQIYDRYGFKVFEMANYTDEFKGFSNLNNIPFGAEKGLPIGVYFYTINIPEEDLNYQGFLYLARLTTAQMQAITPLRGALVYNTDTNCVHYFNGAVWNNLCTTTQAGTFTFVDNNNGTFTINYSDGTSFISSDLTGPQGPQGDAGLQGMPGAIGDKGPTGDKGIVGDKGLTGDTGDKGEVGDKGETGDKGLTGDTGDKGLTGDTGDKGLTGDTGDKGIVGDK
ncbi:C-terminal domain of CHU protein family-domain-containing protein, partial [Baffinella frigidus]